MQACARDIQTLNSIEIMQKSVVIVFWMIELLEMAYFYLRKNLCVSTYMFRRVLINGTLFTDIVHCFTVTTNLFGS